VENEEQQQKIEELETVDRENSERKARRGKDKEKDDGNHGQAHP